MASFDNQTDNEPIYLTNISCVTVPTEVNTTTPTASAERDQQENICTAFDMLTMLGQSFQYLFPGVDHAPASVGRREGAVWWVECSV